MTNKPKRKICFPIMSRIHYARQKHLLELLRKDPRFELQLVVGGSMLLEKYGEKHFSEMKDEGFPIAESLFNMIEGGNHVTMAKTAGLTALEFTNSLHKLNPDIVVIRGDRFEQLAMAMVAAYLNKTIAHIEGGDLSGTIDESIRHAITKLAHIHFVTNKDAYRRVVQMGENPAHVFHVGSPDVEFAANVKKKLDQKILSHTGVGGHVDTAKPFIIVMQHPVTTESGNRTHMETTLDAVNAMNIPAVWFWPNSDAGTAEMAKAIRVYRELGKLTNDKIQFVTDLLPEDFIALLKKAKCLVGNSSAGIKEASYLGTPVVNIGTRQANRLRGPNVIDVNYDHVSIKKAIEKQLQHGPYASSSVYYKPDTSKRMVEILAKAPLEAQKKFYETT